MNQLVFINNGQPFTDSLTVAVEFQKEHDHVMRDIRQQIAKLNEAGEREWGISNFGETQYQHPQNKQWYSKFDLTEDAFAIVAMAYTTPEAMKMKVRFLEEFKRMRNQLQPATVEDLIIMQAQSIKDMRQRVDTLEHRTNKAAETVKEIRDTFLFRDEDWRNKINGLLNGATRRLGKSYRDMRTTQLPNA
ncbi:Rha family transcriptional regulator [Paenibacillus graminis]|uniref:Rha family transcriptional regulator n=1 Tax=Paenibacillus graminis TaxID=189425 RepID=UPI002DBEDB82|nr:Rha family transcriptional regulator [Paenibacillus graminis]MEC0173018.1 Rha family transcriptional regulator [Paenibacillus graminis]